MPRLPSGRLIALGNAPYRALVGRALDTKDPGLLLFYDRDSEFNALLQVLRVEWCNGIPTAELDPIETGEGLKHGILSPSGFTVQEAVQGRVPWSRSDIVAFRRFLETPRIARWMADLRKDLMWLCGWLATQALSQPGPYAMLPRTCVSRTELAVPQE